MIKCVGIAGNHRHIFYKHMKVLTCKEIGGPCDHRIVADSLEELLEKGSHHIKTIIDEPHMRIFEEMLDATPEESKAWLDMVAEKWKKAKKVEE